MSAPEGLEQARAEFADAVNMTAGELEDWLGTDRSRKDEQTDDDVAHMRKVVGYVNRHSAQRPDHSDAELADSAWAASLKNWGHDPLR